MKKDSKNGVLRVFTGFLNIFFKLIPFLLGIYGFYPLFKGNEERIYPFLDAVYASIRLYLGEMEEGITVGAVLQIARFLALTATFGILIDVFDKTTDIVNWFKLCKSGTTVVYGDSNYADYLYESLNKHQRIRGMDKLIKGASRYLIMYSDDSENLLFLNRHYEKLKNKDVHIMLGNVSKQNIKSPHIFVFSIAENCARQYWRDYPVKKNEKIAIIGFDEVGRNLLLYGLQVNLFDPEQHLEYHIFGDGRAFRREHTELDQMAPDEIIFHDDGVYDYAEIAEFDRIILCSSSDEIAAASKLLISAPIRNPIYMYAPNGDIVTNLFGDNKVICFGTAEEMASIDMILNQRSMEAARKQHEFYVSQYGGTPWEELDSFKRYSNVSSSDYMYVIERLIEEGVPAEKLAELEHIRWCRYHYLNNWKYDKVTDPAKRHHNCLIPFAELSEEEKLKDIESIQVKMKK